MKTLPSKLLCVLISSTLLLTACKRAEKPADSTPAAPAASVAPAASGNAAATVTGNAAGSAAGTATGAVAANGAAPATAAVVPFDVSTVPVSTAALPPFPFIAMPKELGEDFHTEEIDFERIYVLAGQQLRPVEGHYSERSFSLTRLKMSPLAAFRNYDEIIKSVGAVPVNTVLPADPAFVAQNGGDGRAIIHKLRQESLETEPLPNEVPTFVQYLVHTPTTNVWIAFSVLAGGGMVRVVVLEEKALGQKAGLVTAPTPAPAPAR